MSIDEVMDRFDTDLAGDRYQVLRAAIEQHVAEEVAKEREVCAELADECATWGGSNFCIAFERLAAAIRARAEKGTP